MADQQHMEILRRGEEVWNQWRYENPEIVPDLQNAELKYAEMRGFNFSHSGMQGADLSETILNGSNFRSADLSGANLCSAAFSGSNLDSANLSYTRLAETTFIETSLSQTDFTKAMLFSTVFGGTDLGKARGLEDCEHVGPSIIDHSTLGRSGTLPLRFLRGCGLPEALITYLPSLFTHAIQFYSCFISYSTIDQNFADRLHADLQNKGVRCWFAPHDIQGGKKVHEQIDNAIRIYQRLLLILSPASMNSKWVQTEIVKARKRECQEKRRMLFPLRLTDFEVLSMGMFRQRYGHRFSARNP
jgi:TIR domain/Pentapeptide repeats (8 copies)